MSKINIIIPVSIALASASNGDIFEFISFYHRMFLKLELLLNWLT